MKNTINECLLLLLLCILVMFSCSKHGYPIDIGVHPPIDTTHAATHIIEFGKASFKKDSVLWSSENLTFSFGRSSDFKRFGFSARKVYSYLKHDFFGIDDIPTSIGIYPLLDIHTGTLTQFTPGVLFSITTEYDKPSGDYSADPTRKTDNFIEIINFNPADSTIEGRFQAFLVRDTMISTPMNQVADKINITEGKFYIKLH